MNMPDCFMYGANHTEFAQRDDLVVQIPAGINSKAELLRVLYEELTLPGYFGFNWDALSECLRDLSWTTKRRIVLFHEAVPSLEPTDLTEYLSILADSIRDWKPNEEHALLAVFPIPAKQVVRDVLGG